MVCAEKKSVEEKAVLSVRCFLDISEEKLLLCLLSAELIYPETVAPCDRSPELTAERKNISRSRERIRVLYVCVRVGR